MAYTADMSSPRAQQRSDGVETCALDRLGHLLWEVAAQTSVLGDAAFADSPLSIPLTGLLDQIADTPGVTVSEISRRLPTTQQAVSDGAKRLAKLGFIERRLGPARGVELHLTRAGAAAHQHATQLEKTFEQRLRALLGDEEYDQLRSLLRRARNELEPSVAAARSSRPRRAQGGSDLPAGARTDPVDRS